ncbi:transcriptional regulator [Sphingomonas fennica]|uniref:Transcriptional regulator n=2 Tax=Edaphosphingomonas fennica TaxID=114404 RepID=A0A2T4HQ31_9SPHN|nr:transcriptional regulator [Sphingomonas fennica]
MRDAILFAGPSLWGSGMPIPPGIALRPPAACGDIVRALAERPRAIGLVDGIFETRPSVWHKEILAALAEGVPVLGAASLGAIRAAELHSCGMIGVGAIFRAYRSGLIERDDAVMVSHAPPALAHRPLTVALVDIGACTRNWPDADRRLVLRIADRLNFRDRNWDRLAALFRERAGREMPAPDRAISRKRRDAERLVSRLTQGVDRPVACPPPPETPWFRRLRQPTGEAALGRYAEAGRA